VTLPRSITLRFEAGGRHRAYELHLTPAPQPQYDRASVYVLVEGGPGVRVLPTWRAAVSEGAAMAGDLFAAEMDGGT